MRRSAPVAYGPRTGGGSPLLRRRVRRRPVRTEPPRVMEERRLGPVVGVGTWNTFDRDERTAKEVVGAALDAGCRVFDTSPMYGGAEASLGAALESRRDGAAVATKIWARSVEEGRVHRLGVTHYSAGGLRELAGALRTRRFDTVQVPLNPLDRACEEELLPLVASLGVAVIVMRPLGAGALVRRTPPSSALADLGVETWSQALLKWALSDERVDLVIPATRNPDHARSNALAGTPPWFDAEQRLLVERLAVDER